MRIEEYFEKLTNHPILFVGTGMSLRYLENSYSWEGLLKEIVLSYKNEEHFLELKNNFSTDGLCDYPKLASKIKSEFESLFVEEKEKTGKFKSINDKFFDELHLNHQASRFKIYISELLSTCKYRQSYQLEIEELKTAKKNIATVITTNYDQLIEEIFDFHPLIGNDIMLSNPYGSVYKIHGSITDPNGIIIDEEDYAKFEKRYELIRAELLSLFIHHPIIFFGYSISDENIRKILQTIFSYVEYGSELAEKIKNNFLLVEYDPNQKDNRNLSDFVIQVENDNIRSLIKINRITTDDFTSIYRAIASLSLPVSVMDIRRVQNIVKDIQSGEGIKVEIVGDIESVPNSERILFIGDKREYVIQKSSSYLCDYFKLIENKDLDRIALIDKVDIFKTQWFPIFGFTSLCDKLEKYECLKEQQINKLKNLWVKLLKFNFEKRKYNSVVEILDNPSIAKSKRVDCIVLAILEDRVPLESIETYLKNYSDVQHTDYKKILCAYDYQKYSKDKGYILTA